MSIDIKITGRQVSHYMERIQRLFKAGSKITVLVRNPSVQGDADFLLTDDDLTEVLKAVERRKTLGKSV